MKKSKKLILLIIVVLSIIRYRTLNGGFNINYAVETQIFGYNEIVEIGNNNCSMDSNCNNGWKVELKDHSISNMNSYKLIVIKALLYNDNKETSSINLKNFELLGIDWFETIDSQKTIEYNTVNNYDIDNDLNLTLQSKSSIEINLVFKLSQENFTEKRFKTINEEKMKLEITTFPVNKLIQVI